MGKKSDVTKRMARIRKAILSAFKKSPVPGDTKSRIARAKRMTDRRRKGAEK